MLGAATYFIPTPAPKPVAFIVATLCGQPARGVVVFSDGSRRELRLRDPSNTEILAKVPNQNIQALDVCPVTQ